MFIFLVLIFDVPKFPHPLILPKKNWNINFLDW